MAVWWRAEVERSLRGKQFRREKGYMRYFQDSLVGVVEV